MIEGKKEYVVSVSVVEITEPTLPVARLLQCGAYGLMGTGRTWKPVAQRFLGFSSPDRARIEEDFQRVIDRNKRDGEGE